MYCNNCGKPTDGESTLCNDCLATMRAQEANRTALTAEFTDVSFEDTTPAVIYEDHYTAPQENKASKSGFGGALTSTILSNVGAYFAAIFMILSMLEPGVGIALSLFIALPMFIVSLILGIKAIKCFKNTEGKKPVATLILGIVGVVSAASIGILIFLTITLGSAVGSLGLDYNELFELYNSFEDLV